jgi:hypothetical protein
LRRLDARWKLVDGLGFKREWLGEATLALAESGNWRNFCEQFKGAWPGRRRKKKEKAVISSLSDASRVIGPWAVENLSEACQFTTRGEGVIIDGACI